MGITRRLNAARAFPGGVFPARESESPRSWWAGAHPDRRRYGGPYLRTGKQTHTRPYTETDVSTYTSTYTAVYTTTNTDTQCRTRLRTEGGDGCATTRIRFYRHVRRFSFGIRANGVTSLICVIPLPESIACHRNSHSRLDAVQTDGEICWAEYDYRRQCKI